MTLPESIRGRDGVNMVLVPEGDFIMGIDGGARYESPAHLVFAPAYYIDQYLVTVGQFVRFLQSTKYQTESGLYPHSTTTGEDRPIVHVTWNDAIAYAKWAKKELPTEVQWEKAARGTDGRKFPWGNRWSRSKCCCWAGGARELAPVGSLKGDVSPYGCYDMAGNAGEWLRNWSTLRDYSELPEGNLTEEFDGNGLPQRSGRGGNWFNTKPFEFACFTRGSGNPSRGHDKISFRCVLDIESAREQGLI